MQINVKLMVYLIAKLINLFSQIEFKTFYFILEIRNNMPTKKKKKKKRLLATTNMATAKLRKKKYDLIDNRIND